MSEKKVKKEFKWEYGTKRSNGVFWGMILLLAAAMLIISGMGVNLGNRLTVWRILLGAVCLGWMVERIAARQIPEAVLPLALLGVIFQPVILNLMGREEMRVINEWLIIGAGFLVMIGLKLIFPSTRRFTTKNKKVGTSSIYLDAADMADARIHDNLGSVQVFVTNIESYAGNGKITVTDNLGQVILHIPQSWMFVLDTHDNLGQVEAPERGEGVYTNTVRVEVYDNLGRVEITYDDED